MATVTEDASPPTWRRTPLELVLAGVVGLLPVAFSPASTSPAWLPKTSLVVAFAPAAFVVLVLQRRHRAAQLGLAFALVGCLAAAFSPSPLISAVGPYATGTSVVLYLAVVGLYAIGRTIPGGGRRELVEQAFLVAAALNATLSLLQARLDLSAYGLEIVESRSAALLGNPVHLATVLAAAFPLAWVRLRDARGRSPQIGVVALLAAGAQVSGSRFLLLGLVVAALALVATRRDVAALLFAGAIALGALVGGVVGQRPDFAGASDRISGVGLAEGSTLQRVYTWQEAVPTVLDRPLLGVGPGRYLQATIRHRSLPLAKAGTDSYFADAHNLLVNVAVDTGVVGLGLFLAWLWVAVRAARGPCLWAAMALLAMHLVEPAHPGTTPLIGVFLGAAAGSWPRERGAHVRRRASLAAAGILGAAAALTLLVGDVRLQTARLDGDRVAAAEAARQLPPWPEVKDAVARLVIFDAIAGRDDRLWAEAADLERQAVAVDRTDPRWWMLAGLVEAKAGQSERAATSFRAALRLNPYSCGAWNGLERLHVPLPGGDARYGSLC